MEQQLNCTARRMLSQEGNWMQASGNLFRESLWIQVFGSLFCEHQSGGKRAAFHTLRATGRWFAILHA
jgi:hypothetical protein